MYEQDDYYVGKRPVIGFVESALIALRNWLTRQPID